MHLSRFHEPFRAAGAAICVFLLTTLTVSAQTPPNTPPGSPTVALSDPLFADLEARWFGSQHPVIVTFSNVTGEGSTWLESRPTLTPAPPAGLQAGSPPFSYDIQTTASFEGRVGVCIDLRGMAFARPQSALQIFTTTGDSWRPLENQTAPSPDRLCGETTTLGTFAIFYPEVRTTAITTMAGTGLAEGSLDGPGGDASDDFGENVAATQSALTRPGRMARDAAGNIYVVDNGSAAGPRVRRIDPGGTIATVVAPGICADSWPIAVDAAGRLLYCVQWSQLQPGRLDIVQVDLAASSHSVVVAGQNEVLAMVIDGNGHLFFSEGSTGSIHRLPVGSAVTQLIFRYDAVSAPLTLTDWERIWTLAFDAENHLVGGGYTLIRISPGADGRVDGSADETVRRIAGVTASNVVSYQEPFSGDGLPASRALIMPTYQMIVAADGAVVFADYSARIRRIEPGADGVVNGGDDEIVRTIAGYYHPLWWMATPSDFATSEYGLFRGVLEDPLSPGSFIVSSLFAHKVQRFGLPASDVPQPSGADLSVHVTAAPDPVDAGASLTYSATVRNHGPAGARATLTMPVSAADVSSVSASSPAGFCTIPFFAVVSFGNVVCDAGLIAPGGQVVITIQVTPKKAGSLVATFTAAVDRDDEVPANNTATVTTTVVEYAPPPVVLTAVEDGYTVGQGGLLGAGLTRVAQVPGSPRPWSIRSLTDVNGTLFFVDPGGRLNTSDGTAAGTIPLTGAIFDPALRSSRERIAFNGALFFAGYEAATGTELWKSDGTAAGTGLFKDIQPGALQSSPRDMVVANGTLFFIADMVTVEDGVIGFELWRSDGTAAGTALVKAFRAPTLSLPFNKEVFPRNVDGTLFFKVAYGPDRGVWKSDGTAHGTVRVADLDVQGKPVALNGSLIFLAWQNNFWHPDLWLADGSGARLLKENHETTANPSKFDGFAAINGQLYFGMTDYEYAGCSTVSGVTGCAYSTTRSVWTSDGTPSGTRLVKAFPSFTSPYRDYPPFVFTGSGNIVLFDYDGDLWKTDGTSAGTTIVADVRVLPGPESASGLTDVNGTLYFAGRTDAQLGLWKSDGTTAGIVLVKAADNLAYAATELTAVDGGLYFVLPYDDARMPELWIAGVAPSVLANDTVVTTLAVSAAVAQPPSHGTLAFHDDGTFLYRPEAGFTGDDSFGYRLTSGTVTSPIATVTIHVTPAPISIGVSDASVIEGNAGQIDLVFNVTRSGDVSQVASVGYSTGGGTATVPLGYTPVSGTLTFAAGETVRQVVVPVSGDTTDESDETLLLNLANAVGAMLTRTRAFGTIVDDDDPPQQGADIAVLVSAAPAPVDTGASLTYSVSVRNNGPVAAHATVEMPVSALDVSTVSAASPAGFCTIPFFAVVTFGNVMCDAGLLAPGREVLISIQVTPTKPGALSASFTATGDGDDAVPSNNSVTVTTTVLDRVAPSAVITAPAIAALGTSLTASAAGSTDGGGGRTVRYRWELTPGGAVLETTAPSVIFPVDAASPLPAGPYQVALTVFDDSGNASLPVTAVITVVSITVVDDRYTVRQDSTLVSGTALVTQLPAVHPALWTEALERRRLINVSGTLMFADTAGNLWKTDGTPGGTTLIGANLRAKHLVEMNGMLYFQGWDSQHRTELWKSDGTVAGTMIVSDIAPGALDSSPRDLTNVNGTLFFITDTVDPNAGVIGTELWRSDGTADGTVRVRSFSGRTDTSFLRNVGGTVFFRRISGVLGQQGLWKSDGSPEGTVNVALLAIDGQTPNPAVKSFVPWFPDWPAVFGTSVVFQASQTPTGFSGEPNLWLADDTNGARLLKTLNPVTGHRQELVDHAAANGRLYFGIDDIKMGVIIEPCEPADAPVTGSLFNCPRTPGETTREVWSSDGTVAGTSLIKTFGPYPNTSGAATETPFFFTGSGGDVFFVNGHELWKTDGTALGTSLVRSVIAGNGNGAQGTLTDVDGVLFFTGREGGAYGVWKSDGTPAGTSVVKSVQSALAYDLTNVNGALYFTVPREAPDQSEVWVTGTARGLLVNDGLPAALAMTASVASAPSHGTLILDTAGTFRYRPHAGFSGDDSFTYIVTAGTITSAPATVTIHVTPTLPTLSISEARITEGQGGTADLSFTVTRRGDTSGASSADFATGGGSATASTDYQPVSGTLTFAPGDTTREVVVAVMGDLMDEPDEVLHLNLANAVGATLGRSRGFGTIVGDDFHADLEVAATAAPDPVVVAATLTYQVVIKNQGPRRATGIVMTMPVDLGAMTSVSATSPAGTCIVPLLAVGGSSPVSCDAGGLESGSSITITVSLTPKIPGEIVTTFAVTGAVTDPIDSNNAVTVRAAVSAPLNYVFKGGVLQRGADSSGAPMPVLTEFTLVTSPGLILANPIPGPPPPPEFAVVGQTFDVVSTAVFTGPITVCITDSALRPSDRLFHFEGGEWVDVTATGMPSPTQVCGRTYTLSPFAIMRDVTPPAITIGAPAATSTYTLGATVRAEYACTDRGSGLTTCGGPVTSGAPLDTAAVGSRTFTVNATDVAGNIATLSRTYRVSYGVCLLYDALRPKKSGSTVPIALQLCDANGRNYSSPDIALMARGVQFVAGGDVGPAEDSGHANPDAGFRYDAARAGYVFNLKTTGFAQGLYRLTFTIGPDPTVRAAEFRVR